MSEPQSDPLGAIISKAWSDESFKNRLLSNTRETLAAEGVDVPEGFEVKAVENSDHVYHLVIPARPAAASSEPGAISSKSACVCALLLDWTGLLQ